MISNIPPMHIVCIIVVFFQNQLPLDCLRLVSSGSLEALAFAISHMAFLLEKEEKRISSTVTIM